MAGQPSAATSSCLSNKTFRNQYQTAVNTSCSTAELQQDYLERCSDPVQEWRMKRQQLQTNLDAKKAILTNLLEAASVSQTATGPVDAYLQELKDKEAALKEKNFTMQQGIRAGRRRFLDDDPQRGVPGILGLQTKDDKVLLVFWICFLLGLTAIYSAILIAYGDALNLQTGQQKVGTFVGLIGLSVGIAYYFINRYA